MSTTNQTHVVRDHLIKFGSITGVAADSVYKIRWLPTRIHALRAEGYVINSVWKRDGMGQKYVRYSLVSVPQKEVKEAA